MKKQIERPGCTKAWSFLQPGRGQSPDLGGAGGLQSRNIRFGPSGDCRDCAKMAEKQKENRYKRGESRRREGGEEQEEKNSLLYPFIFHNFIPALLRLLPDGFLLSDI